MDLLLLSLFLLSSIVIIDSSLTNATEICCLLFAAGCDDISSADVASLLREAIQIGHSPSK